MRHVPHSQPLDHFDKIICTLIANVVLDETQLVDFIRLLLYSLQECNEASIRDLIAVELQCGNVREARAYELAYSDHAFVEDTIVRKVNLLQSAQTCQRLKGRREAVVPTLALV